MKKLLVILILCSPVVAYTQEWSLEYSLGYGSYQLDDVKAMQDMTLSFAREYGLKETDRFPSYVTQTVALGYIAGYHHVGANFSYLTTGGRLHTADYSGSYTIDMIINGYRLGLFYRYYINTGFSPLNIYLQISPGVLFSNLSADESIIIGSESAMENNILKSTGAYIEPTIGVTYRITNWMRFSVGGGYQADLWGTLKYEGQETQNKAHWNGLRLYGSIMLTLPNRN